MKQPVRGQGKLKIKKKKVIKGNPFRKGIEKKHTQEYGTSQLERDFARDFLDRLGLKYVYQFEAKDIKRFFDFAVTAEENYPYKYIEKDGLMSIDQDAQLFIPNFLIEVDGDYWHGNPNMIDEKKGLSPMQKHNKFIDKLKDEWCGMHCIPLLRIWENDIRRNPKKVTDMICEYSSAARKRKMIMDNKKRPH